MLGFFHSFSSFSQLQPLGWSLPKFCQNAFIKLWRQQYFPITKVNTGSSFSEPDMESCASEYMKFVKLVTSYHNPKVLFLAIDAITNADSGSAIVQFGLSAWIPQEMTDIMTLQWQVQGSSCESMEHSTTIASDDIHLLERYNICVSDIEEILRRQLLRYTPEEYELVIVGYDVEKMISKFANKLKIPVGASVLDTRKIWLHKHHGREYATLEDCIQDLSLPCRHPPTPSAGNNAYHITQILAGS
ncbi:hypothetical protein PG996_015457 [Apiospora saccharicola]|uniref:Uncharacterized protein n=1 Tax=Apiospora saccharicola TaxID=335842 RepID=A0ABR1TLA2_9PEZI